MFAPLGIHNVLSGGRGFSAESMAHIGVLLDNKGKYGQWEVFSEKTYDAILPTSLTPYFPDLEMEYGIGLQNAKQQLGARAFPKTGSLIAPDMNWHWSFWSVMTYLCRMRGLREMTRWDDRPNFARNYGK